MITLTIDDTEVSVEPGATIIQACEQAGVEIPRFCYHERLSIAGNCRMCLVEVEGGPPKPAASCAMPAADGMVVRTNTPMVQKAREGVMEFLLINHPLDCPICDQGGECDLQDQSVAYGRGANRFHENKRAVTEKYMGPLIKTHMTRCIHCTRCIRFVEEVAGVPELGAVGRGEGMEVTTYVEQALHSELSANIIDLCPVGALTSRPYAFKARPWELKKTLSVDVLDAVGSNIRVDSRHTEVLRILPVNHDDINEEWISDKTRYACDGLKTQRLDRPYVRRDGMLTPATWDEAFDAIAEALGGVLGTEIAAIAGDLCDAESMLALKELMRALGSPHTDCRQHGTQEDPANRTGYLFNTTIAGIEDADACLIIGADPRREAALINARLRKRFLQGGFQVANIGQVRDLTFPVKELGENPQLLREIAEGKHAFANVLKTAERPMLILGQAALMREDTPAILHAASQVAEAYGMIQEDWNGFNVLHTAASRVGGLDIGFAPGNQGKSTHDILAAASKGGIKAVYLLGADEVDTGKLKDCFVVYQGHHGDAGAHAADVILPGAAYTEKYGAYVNTEGRVQHGQLAIFPPGDAREDWTILRALSERLGHTLSYDTLEQLRAHMVEIAPHFAETDAIAPAPWQPVGEAGEISNAPFSEPVPNFYRTDPISRASRTMAECTRTVLERCENTGDEETAAAA